MQSTYLCSVMRRWKWQMVMGVGLLALSCTACQKHADFVDEARLGAGIHYLPQFLNATYVDTLTGVPIGDSLLNPGQHLIFEVLYHSQDSLVSLDLLQSINGSSFQLTQSLPYQSSMYSPSKQADTGFLSYAVPDSLPGSSQIQLMLQLTTRSSLSTTTLLSCRTH